MLESSSVLAERASEVIRGFDGVRLALLFGSVARGTTTPSSDVDVAVDAPGVDLRELGARISEAVAREVDIVDLSAATIPLLLELIDHSVVLWESQPAAGALWRSRTLARLEIDGPWYRRMADAWLAAAAERGVGDGQ